MTPPIALKLAGRLPRVPLKELGNVSLAQAQVDEANAIDCLTPDEPDDEILAAERDDLRKVCIQHFGKEYMTPGPDHGLINIADAVYLLHERAGAIGSGSWPPGNRCHPLLYPHDNYHATTCWIDRDVFRQNASCRRLPTDAELQSVVVSAGVWPRVDKPFQSLDAAKAFFVYKDGEEEKARANDAKIGDRYNLMEVGFWLAFESTRRAGCLLIPVWDGPNGKHGMHGRMYAMPGNLNGLGYFPDGRCGQSAENPGGEHVTWNIDSLNDYSLVWFTGLVTHEIGHCLDLRHEFREPQRSHRSVMSYAQERGTTAAWQGYRLNGEPYEYVEDHSWQRLRSLFNPPAKPIAEDKPPSDGESGRWTGNLDWHMEAGTVVVDTEPMIGPPGREQRRLVVPPSET